MGSSDSVPAAFQLTVVDGRERLTFAETSTAAPLACGAIQRLTLDAPATGRDGGGGDGGIDQVPRSGLAEDAASIADRFQGRRLLLRAATLVIQIDRLREALDACPLAEEGVVAPRLWMAAGGFRLAGRFAMSNREAPFTIRVSVDVRTDGRRRLRIGFADVRLFGPLPMPGPLVGVAVARAITSAAAGAGADVRLVDAAIDIDPLELALVFSLVTQGWRLPDLRQGWLQSLVQSANDVQLQFGADGYATEGPAILEPVAPPAPLARVEGERLSEMCAAAEQLLFAGDLSGAEHGYRTLCADGGADRAMRARLLSLRVAALGDDAPALANHMMDEWPDYLPGFLQAATAAVLAGDAARAADLFSRAASRADALGDHEDAALAREAAATVMGLPPRSRPAADNDDTDHDLDGAGAGGSRHTDGSSDGDILVGHDAALRAPPTDAALARGDLAEADALSIQRLDLAADEAASPAPSQPSAPVMAPTPGMPAVVQAVESGKITAATAAVYADPTDPESRARALGDLLQGFERLSPERRHDAYASFGRVAESSGDLDHAEEAYWRATSETNDPARRANDLAAHARVLLSRGNRTAAVTDLEEALRLLPLDAVTSLTEVRQSLGDLSHSMGDWNAARHYLELVLSHDPARVAALERLADIYPRLGLFPAAAAVLERLARRYNHPRQRAEALWRQGDILRERLGDEARAFEAYLKSSDLDPTFAPTALRVIAGFWAEGQVQEVATVADDLVAAGGLPEMDDPLRLRVGIAVALARADAASAAEMVGLAGLRWNADMAAAILAETAAHLSHRPSHEIEPAVALLELWRTTATADAPGSAGGSVLTELWSALRAQVMEDPAAAGLARATGWIAERAGDATAASVFLSVATFIEEADPVAAGPPPGNLDDARQTLAQWDEFRAHSDGPVAPAVVRACHDIVAGLRALHQIEAAAVTTDPQVPERARRIEFLRTGPARDLLRFLVSDSYARALANADA